MLSPLSGASAKLFLGTQDLPARRLLQVTGGYFTAGYCRLLQVTGELPVLLCDSRIASEIASKIALLFRCPRSPVWTPTRPNLAANIGFVPIRNSAVPTEPNVDVAVGRSILFKSSKSKFRRTIAPVKRNVAVAAERNILVQTHKI